VSHTEPVSTNRQESLTNYAHWQLWTIIHTRRDCLDLPHTQHALTVIQYSSEYYVFAVQEMRLDGSDEELSNGCLVD
jgi:hypothetical protein